MLYQLHFWQKQSAAPWRIGAELTRQFYTHPLNPLSYTNAGRTVAALSEMYERFTRHFAKPAFGIDAVEVDGKSVPVLEQIVKRRTFCQLRRFWRADIDDAGVALPKVLLVAPMSGHFATLLRGTV